MRPSSSTYSIGKRRHDNACFILFKLIHACARSYRLAVRSLYTLRVLVRIAPLKMTRYFNNLMCLGGGSYRDKRTKVSNPKGNASTIERDLRKNEGGRKKMRDREKRGERARETERGERE